MTATRPRPFAGLLRYHRVTAGLSQQELASRAGLSPRTVSDLERGVKVAPRAATVALLAAALQLAEHNRAVFAAAARVQPPHAHGQTSAIRAAPAGSVWGQSVFPPLVGRATELAHITRHLAGDGPPLFLIAGEPGIGKSRLLQDTARSAQRMGWHVLESGCHRRSGQEPYAPLLGALERYFRAQVLAGLRVDLTGCAWLARLLPELIEMGLVPAPAWTLPPDQERRLMFASVRRFFANIAGAAGTLLVLDDLQWAGADALDLLASLVRAASEHGATDAGVLRVVGAYRATEVDLRHPLGVLSADLMREGLATQERLGPLTPAAAAELFSLLLGEPQAVAPPRGTAHDAGSITPEMARQATGAQREIGGETLCEKVLRQVEGVPFFLLSCAQAQRMGTLSEADAVPWTVGQSIRQRVADLPEAAHELLGLAAVMGRQISRTLLWAVAARLEWGVRASLAALEATLSAGLLVEEDDGLLRFGHDLIREVVLADLSAARRAAWHLAVAQTLEQASGDQPFEVLAYHYTRSGQRDKAALYLERAGDRAAQVHAHADAASHYRELVSQLDSMGRVIEAAQAREKLASALTAGTHFDEALVCFEQALQTYRERGELQRLAWAAARIGWAHMVRGTPQQGIDHLQTMVRVFEEAEHTYGLALMHTTLADLFYAAGRYSEQLAVAERATGLARLVGDELLLTQEEQLRGRALLLLGPLDEGLQVMQEALRLARTRDDLTRDDLSNLCLGQGMACLAFWAQGRFDAAAEAAGCAVVAARRLGDPVHLALALAGVGMVAWYRGDWEEARRTLDEAHAEIQHAEATIVLPYVAGMQGMIELAMGQSQVGAEHLALAVHLAERIGDLLPQRFAQAALAEADLVQGRPARARERLLPLLDHDDQHETFATRLLPLVAWAELELKEHAAAQTRITQALARSRAGGLQLALVDALRVQALVALRHGQWGEAAVALEEALVLSRAMPYPYAEAKALYVSGLLHLARNEPVRGRERFEAARAICERLGERLYASCIQQEPTERTA